MAGIWQSYNGTPTDVLRRKSTTALGIPANGTNQTSALVSLLTSMGNASERGILHIAYGTSFDTKTVYASVPTGVVLQDESSINYGQPPSYKNRALVIYSGDLVADDTYGSTIASNHHPSIVLNNFGGAPSSFSADNRYTSVLYAVGINQQKDPILARQMLHSKAPSKEAWRWSLLQIVPYNAAMATYWTVGLSATSGTTYVYYANRYYVAASTGTTGATPPTHTSGTVSDGTVSWTYVGPYSTAATDFYVDTDGVSGFSTVNNQRINYTAGAKNFYQEINSSTGDLTLYDATGGAPVLKWNATPKTASFTSVYAGTGSVPGAVDAPLAFNQQNYATLIAFGASSQTGLKFYMAFRALGLTFGTKVSSTETDRLAIDTSGNLIPAVTNTYALGTTALRWASLWAKELRVEDLYVRSLSGVLQTSADAGST